MGAPLFPLREPRGKRVCLAVAGLGLILLAALTTSRGAVDLGWSDLASLLRWRWFGGTGPNEAGLPPPETLWAMVTAVRLPRVVLACLTGAALAAAGAGMQGLFRNPLADPSLTGVSAGAAAGAVTAIVLGSRPSIGTWLALGGAWAVPLSALLGGAVVTVLVYRLSQVEGRTLVASMLLSGIAINALGMAYVGFVLFFADYGQVREFQFWTLGSCAGASWSTLGATAPLVLVPLLLLPRLARSLNAFLLGESEAFHLGVPVQRVKLAVIALTAALVGATVAVAGVIGFVGLIVPHVTRLVLGPDHRWLLPGSMIGGAILLLGADLAARSLVAPAELPVGILTALLGAPFFLGLLRYSRTHGLN